MPLVAWDDSFVLGIEQFDDQHRQLVKLVNELYDANRNGILSNLEAVLGDLVDYATYHFSTEEHWMRANGYPGLDEHIHQHEDFSCKIVTLELEFKAGRADITEELLSFLSSWLVEHMQESDGKYASFARQAAAAC